MEQREAFVDVLRVLSCRMRILDSGLANQRRQPEFQVELL